ncbi:MAG: 50S ribosomal protein L10 [Candidatus Omnitrophota bacterium]|nr:50S ribosomal protein L10 [Candidatus Omnitrophota bacterium]
MANVGRLVKEAMVGELSGWLSDRKNLFVTRVNRLPASEADAFRQKLHASQARLVVVTRRLGRRVVEQLQITGLPELLEGSVGLVWGEDVLPTAKLLVEFAKAHEAQLSVRGAVVDGQLLDASRVEALASLPPVPVLRAQVIWTVESPIAELIATVEQLIGEVAWVVEEASKTSRQETVTG